MTVEVRQDEKLISISAEKRESVTVLTTSATGGDELLIKPFMPDQDEPSYRAYEKEPDYFKEAELAFAGRPAMTLINSLPTPMFLDLDRRSRAIQERKRVRYRPLQLARRTRNIFSFFLSQSLNLATERAEEHNTNILIAISRLGEELSSSGQGRLPESLHFAESDVILGGVRARSVHKVSYGHNCNRAAA